MVRSPPARTVRAKACLLTCQSQRSGSTICGTRGSVGNCEQATRGGWLPQERAWLGRSSLEWVKKASVASWTCSRVPGRCTRPPLLRERAMKSLHIRVEARADVAESHWGVTPHTAKSGPVAEGNRARTGFRRSGGHSRKGACEVGHAHA